VRLIGGRGGCWCVGVGRSRTRRKISRRPVQPASTASDDAGWYYQGSLVTGGGWSGTGMRKFANTSVKFGAGARKSGGGRCLCAKAQWGLAGDSDVKVREPACTIRAPSIEKKRSNSLHVPHGGPTKGLQFRQALATKVAVRRGQRPNPCSFDIEPES